MGRVRVEQEVSQNAPSVARSANPRARPFNSAKPASVRECARGLSPWCGCRRSYVISSSGTASWWSLLSQCKRWFWCWCEFRGGLSDCCARLDAGWQLPFCEVKSDTLTLGWQNGDWTVEATGNLQNNQKASDLTSTVVPWGINYPRYELLGRFFNLIFFLLLWLVRANVNIPKRAR